MAVAKRLTLNLQRLATQRLRLVILALVPQQIAEVADRGEGIRMAVAKRLSSHLQRLAIQRLRLVVLALIT